MSTIVVFTKLFASMWHKANWMGHPMRLELTFADLLVKLVNHYTIRGALKLVLLLISTSKLLVLIYFKTIEGITVKKYWDLENKILIYKVIYSYLLPGSIWLKIIL